jgi:hypothetical protein
MGQDEAEHRKYLFIFPFSKKYQIQKSDLFQTAMGFYPVAVSLQQFNTQIRKSHTQYTYHTK